MTRPHLLVIPGVGDRVWLYRLIAPLWRLLGYQPHIFRFGWDGSADDLPERQAALVRFVDGLPLERLQVVGASAGGTAAVNLLAARPTIRSVVTVSAPLCPPGYPGKALVSCSIAQTDGFLATATDTIRDRVVSIFGWYDGRVPVRRSNRPGVRGVRVPAVGHGVTIMLTLTVFAVIVRRVHR
jgi:pimeloyl-ACP methyl ester carboxylesterase